MMNDELCSRFRSLSIAKDTLGLEWSNNVDMIYFCTPVGAQIIGWPGVDGIHFCFIPSINSDMVFAVSPMPCGEHHVEPIARNFQEFLSQLLFCKSASPLEQICWMNEKQFLELIKSENDSDWPERDIALKMLRIELGIGENSDTYRYVRNLQAEFDYDTIPFSKEYSNNALDFALAVSGGTS